VILLSLLGFFVLNIRVYLTFHDLISQK